MKFWHKALLAFVVTIVGPLIVGLVMNPDISEDHFGLCLPALIFIVPLFSVALILRSYHLNKTAAGVFSAGMLTYLVYAISTLGTELHGPLIGYTYIPVIAAATPLGLFAIFDRKAAEKKPNRVPVTD